MSSNAAELEAKALQLPPEARAHLADKLLSSLSSNREIEEAWAVAVDRRMAEFEAGSVRDIPIEESQARARKAIR